MIVKTLILLIVAALVFGTGGYFTYEMVIKPKRMMIEEKKHLAENPPTPPPDPSLGDLRKVQKVQESGDLVKARDAYRQFLQTWPRSTLGDEAKDELGQINIAIFFSRYPSPEKEEYVVKSGDALAKISSKMKTTVELIMLSNNLSSTLINVGDHLQVSHPDFALIIDQEGRTVTLYDHGQFFKRFRALEWNVPSKPFRPGAKAKVTSAMALSKGERVAVGSKEYFESNRWVMTTASNITLYSVRPGEENQPVANSEAGEEKATGDKVHEKPPTGIGIAAGEMAELAALVRRGTPITFE